MPKGKQRVYSERPGGQKYYAFVVKKEEEIEDIGSWTLKNRVEVDLARTDGDSEGIMQSILNAVPGDTLEKQWANCADILNEGLIAKARSAAHQEINKQAKSASVVREFQQICELMAKHSDGKETSEVAAAVLEQNPKLKASLSAVGFVFSDDVEDEEENIEE